MPFSNATDSKGSTALHTASDRFTGRSTVWKRPASARARNSRSSTSFFMRKPSSRVFSTQRRCASTVCPGLDSRMPVLARITVSGVLSSCEASAMNCRCWSHAACTGRSAQRDRYRLTNSSAAIASAKPARQLSPSVRSVAQSWLRSTNAMRKPSGRDSMRKLSRRRVSVPAL